VREDPTLAGCRLLMALCIYSNMNTKRPKTYDMLRCSFSMTQTVEQMSSVLPSTHVLPNNDPFSDHSGQEGEKSSQKILAHDFKKEWQCMVLACIDPIILSSTRF